MPKDKLRAAALGGSADDVEMAFYEAMQNGDIERLMACWSDEEDIVCVHPGGPRVLGALRPPWRPSGAGGVGHSGHVREHVH